VYVAFPLGTVNGTATWTAGVTLGSYTSEVIASCESYTTPAATQTWTTSGVYYDTLSNIFGCDSIITYDLTINTSMLDAGLNETQCEGSSVVLNASGSDTYSWSPATGLSTTTGSTVVAGPTSTTTYTVTGTDANGCVGTDSMTFTVNQNPSVDLGGPYYQENPPLTLDAGAGFSSYSWSTSETTQTIDVSTNDTYSVTVVDTNGCSGTGAAFVAFTASLSNIDGTVTFVKVYPNPASSFVQVEVSKTHSPIKVMLFDMTGALLKTAEMNSELLKMDVSNLAAGTYTIHLATDKEEQQTTVIIH